MNRNSKILVMVIAVAAACAIAFFGIRNQMKQHDPDGLKTIKIACNLPLTGDVAIYGESVRNGYNMALEHYQSKLKDNGIRITVDYQDNKGENKNAVAIYQQQMSSGFDIYVSGITQQTFSIKDMVDKTNKPHFIWSFYPLVLSPKEKLFRTWVDHSPELFLKYLTHSDAKRIACVYLNAASGQDLFNKYFIPMLPPEYTVVYNDAFDINTQDFKGIVSKIKESKPDMIFVNGFQNHIIGLVKEFNVAGLKKDGNIVLTFDLLDAMDEVDKGVVEGMVAVIPKFYVSDNPQLKEWSSVFSKRFNREPNYTDIYAYDGFSLICEALIHSKEKQVSIFDSLHAVKVSGISGSLELRDNGTLYNNLVLGKVENGKFVEILNAE